MTPTVSNISPVRFFYGSTTGDDGAVFHGAVVFGTDLSFDPVTRMPISGTVDRIELQTRSSADGTTTHGVYSDFNATVDQLQMAFADANTVWYDPILYFPPVIASALQNHATNDELLLDTGDVLTAKEMSAIFKAPIQLAPTVRPMAIATPSLPPLVIDFDNIVVADENTNVATSYTEDDDVLGDLLFGIA